jgi:hypothetical protein
MRFAIIIATALFWSSSSHAQDGSSESKPQRIHFEIAGVANAGISRPAFKAGDSDHSTNHLSHQVKPFYGAGVRALAAFKSLALNIEGDYTTGDHYVNYANESTFHTGSTSNSAEYELNIQKAEISVFPSLTFGKKHRLSVKAGVYFYLENSKRISGYYHYYSSFYDPTVMTGPGTYQYNTFREDLIFDGNKAVTANGAGALTGISYSIPIKKGTNLFFDLCIKTYKVRSGVHDEAFRFTDAGLSIGYTFWSNKRE